MALKPKSDLDQQRNQPLPVVFASDLAEHREVPSVSARLARVAALANARKAANSGKKDN